MIRLHLPGSPISPIPVTNMLLCNQLKFYQSLRGFASSSPPSPHVRVYGNDVHIIGMFGRQNCVPDVDRYRIRLGSSGLYYVHRHQWRVVAPSINCFNDLRPSRSDFDGTILLILESPHKDEYQNNNVSRPIAPAQRQTGRRICNYLECILNNNGHVYAGINIDNFRVIITNPIPFQTSLWAIHSGNLNGNWRTLRNAIWKTLWNEQVICSSFCTRVRSYDPQIIINSCTFALQSLVTSFLIQCCLTNQFPLYKSHHPSRWTCNTRLV